MRCNDDKMVEELPDRRVSVLWSSSSHKVNSASQVRELSLVYLAHLPGKNLAHWVKTVFTLGGGEAAVQY